MSTIYSLSIVKEGLILFLDAANPRSYPVTGTISSRESWTKDHI